MKMFISPMLLETSEKAFSDNQYLFEPKFDGHRAILSCVGGQTHIYTRHNNECTKQYPELTCTPFTDDMILDGEIVCIDPAGAVDFESVMIRFQTQRADGIRRLSQQLPVTFVVFDVLQFKGEDVRNLPLYKRKEVLASITFNNNLIIKTPFIEGAGAALFKDICAKDMEGIVCKRKDSVYVSRRSDDWLKNLRGCLANRIQERGIWMANCHRYR